MPRCKPFKYTYEKEIVLYAYFKKLDYFSTECIYSPQAYRCGRDCRHLMTVAQPFALFLSAEGTLEHFSKIWSRFGRALSLVGGIVTDTLVDTHFVALSLISPDIIHSGEALAVKDAAHKTAPGTSHHQPLCAFPKPPPASLLSLQGICGRCGYISSSDLCKACLLLEGLNKGVAHLAVGRRSGEVRYAAPSAEIDAAHRPVADVASAAVSYSVDDVDESSMPVVEPPRPTPRSVAGDW